MNIQSSIFSLISDAKKFFSPIIIFRKKTFVSPNQIIGLTQVLYEYQRSKQMASGNCNSSTALLRFVTNTVPQFNWKRQWRSI